MKKSADQILSIQLWRGGNKSGEITLIRGGRSAYLWTGNESDCLGWTVGPTALRKLAKAILDEVPA